MEIKLNNVGKRFAHQWLYRNINYTFSSDHSYAITGPNGSGKSTFLKLLASFMVVSEGEVHYQLEKKPIDREQIFQHVAFTAPYMNLIEEYTLDELYDFHQNFRKMHIDRNEWLDLLQLGPAHNKPIKYFSSGMKQRTNLSLILATAAPLYLIDEPTTNLDRQGKSWFHDLLARFCGNALTIIASNDPSDYVGCDKILNVEDFKTQKPT